MTATDSARAMRGAPVHTEPVITYPVVYYVVPTGSSVQPYGRELVWANPWPWS